MAGYTVQKDPSQRVRRNKDTAQVTTLEFVKGVQPPLPLDRDWHPMTEEWWRTWGESPLSDHMTAVDWNVLKATAILVNKLWKDGSTEAAKEVRLREESFGASILARLRLRIQFRDADENGAAEVRAGAGRSHFQGLAAVRSIRAEAAGE